MRSLFYGMAFWLAILSPVLAGAKPPSVFLRIHLETDASGSSNQAQPVRLENPDQQIYINPIPEVSEKDLIGVDPYAGRNGEQGVLLHFSRHAAVTLGAETMAHEGKILVVILDGRIVYAPVIDAALNSGDFLVPRGVLPQEIPLLQAQVKENLRHK